MSPRALGLLTAFAVALIDQAHKIWMIEVFQIDAKAPIRVTPFLDLVMVWNPGISYGLLSQETPQGRWLLLGLTLAATAFLAAWLWRAKLSITTVALGLIVGGAIGNAVDRWRYGAVADFFHFHTTLPVGPLANYVFNLADIGIVAGVALLLYETIFVGEPPKLDGPGPVASKSP